MMTAADPQTTGRAQSNGDLSKTLDVTPLVRYDALAVNTIVKNRKGGINSCGIPFSGDLPPGSDGRYPVKSALKPPGFRAPQLVEKLLIKEKESRAAGGVRGGGSPFVSNQMPAKSLHEQAFAPRSGSFSGRNAV